MRGPGQVTQTVSHSCVAPRAMGDPACDLRLMGLVARLVSSSVFSNPIVLDRAGGGVGWGFHYNCTCWHVCVCVCGEWGLREGLHNEVLCSEQTVGRREAWVVGEITRVKVSTGY